MRPLHASSRSPLPACRLTVSIMLLGGALLTGSAGNDGQFLAMFLTSLFIFGTGKLHVPAARRQALRPYHAAPLERHATLSECWPTLELLPAGPAACKHTARGCDRHADA